MRQQINQQTEETTFNYMLRYFLMSHNPYMQ